MSKKFYPATSALTKEEVIDMINARRNDPDDERFSDISEPKIEHLSDNLMQNFVDAWHERFFEVLNEPGTRVLESAYTAQERVLLDLAKCLV